MTEQKKKVKACKDTDYLFISAYLRAKEPQLLTEEKAVRMLSSSVQEAARTLEGCGYADVLTIGLDKALNDRRAAVFSEVEALAPKDGVVALFRMRYDYHNAKTIVKAEAMGKDPSGLPFYKRVIAGNMLLNFLTRPDFIAYKFEDRKALSPTLCRTLWGIQEVSWTLRRHEDLLNAERAHSIGIFERFDPDRS